MRLLHTSDWHLGKRLFKLDRSPEHELFLNWIIQTLKDEKIDLLLIAGDIFDTPTPPHQSLEMFYDFLYRVSKETFTQTLIIAGNHDSGLLLEAPSKILSHHRVKVWGKLSINPEDHWIKIGAIEICALPFFRSYELLPNGEGDILEALKKYLVKEKTGPQLLMLHHLAENFDEAGSEQVISLSGVNSIPKELLSTFDYVALGHIHKPQMITSKIYYSGSPIQMRFSESNKKSVQILNLEKDVIENQRKEIPIFRELISIKTDAASYKEDLEKLEMRTELTPMVEVQIKLNAPQIGLIDEIKSIVDKKKMELLSFMPLYPDNDKRNMRSTKLFELSTEDIFKEFYSTKFPDSKEVPDDLFSDFRELLEKVKYASRPS